MSAFQLINSACTCRYGKCQKYVINSSVVDKPSDRVQVTYCYVFTNSLKMFSILDIYIKGDNFSSEQVKVKYNVIQLNLLYSSVQENLFSTFIIYIFITYKIMIYIRINSF